MRPQKGFTLIELLVVISVIALLLSILMPALNMARERGKRIVCLSNLKSLFTTYFMYCDDNDGIMPDSWAQNVHPTTGQPPPGTYSWVYSPPPGAGKYVQEEALRQGKLFKYTETVEIYKCPTAKVEELVTYSIVITMGGHVHGCVTKEHINLKKDGIDFPSGRIVFLDEGKWPGSPWGLHLPSGHGGARIWWDQPRIRHKEGTNWGFADGHAEYQKWQDKATIEFSKRRDVDDGWCDVLAHGSETDYDWLGRGIFGSKYTK